MKKSNLLILAIIAICTFLTGCGTTVVERIVVKTETKLIKVPESFLTPCEVTAPPQREAYVNSTVKQKEELLANFSIDLLKDMRLCNAQIKKIADLQKEQQQIIEKERNKQ